MIRHTLVLSPGCGAVLPVGEDFTAVVNADGQNFITDDFTVVRPPEMLHTSKHTQ